MKLTLSDNSNVYYRVINCNYCGIPLNRAVQTKTACCFSCKRRRQKELRIIKNENSNTDTRENIILNNNVIK